ncbi:hypothetical protein AMK26_14180 [Streptomyces sp. CB03234]|nr:hypothetical protein AMK26_14180 [Streptomyces sp. CB03234]
MFPALVRMHSTVFLVSCCSSVPSALTVFEHSSYPGRAVAPPDQRDHSAVPTVDPIPRRHVHITFGAIANSDRLSGIQVLGLGVEQQ